MKNKFLLPFSFLLSFSALSFYGCSMKAPKKEDSIYDVLVENGYTGTKEQWSSFIGSRTDDQIILGNYYPQSSIGKIDDLFVQTPTLDFFLKEQNKWYVKGNLNGTQVTNVDLSPSILIGSDNPTNTTGQNGDLYINSITGNVYQKFVNEWKIIGSINGEFADTNQTAYERYCEANPNYNKTEGQWVDDLLSGVILDFERHTVTFDSNCGIAVPNQHVVHGEKIQIPSINRKGWNLNGWFYNGEKWSFVGYVCTEDMHLTAEWSKNENELLISEVCSKNRKSYIDFYNENPDYIELYNGTNFPINLENYYISNDDSNHTKCKLPKVIINSKSYLMICADGLDILTENNEIHVPFTLSQPKGGHIFLSSPNKELIDEINFPSLKDDVSFGLLDGEYGLLRATGNAENKEFYKTNEILEAPIFSVRSGKYSDPFDLNIISKYRVFYTTDCSIPTIESAEYVSAIRINDATQNPNVVSARSDISGEEKSRVPNEPVSKCTVIKAIAVDENGYISPVVSSSYWVGQNDFLVDNVPVLSISTTYDNLFDPEYGIYCKGNAYLNWRNGPDYDPTYGSWQIPGNYINEGFDWERLSDLSYLDNTGALKCEQKVGLRIQGNGTRMLSKKSFNVFSRFTYDGNNKFSYRFNNKKCEAFSLKAGSTSNFMMTDVLNSKLAKKINLELGIQDFTGTYLYLNGEFWGYYFLADKFDSTFIEEKYGVKDSVIYKNGLVEEGHPTDINGFNTFGRNVSVTLNNQVLEDLENSTILNSLIDYNIFEYYLANDDWNYWNNCAMWKSKSKTAKSYEDGKLRMLLFDTDHTTLILHPIDCDSTTIVPYSATYKILVELCGFKDYKEKILNRIQEICDAIESEETINYLEEFYNANKYQALQSYNRFHGTALISALDSTYEKYSAYFINKRSSYVINQLTNRINSL